MLKILFLQSCYGVSDQEMEFQVYDRLSFQQFLGFPERIPDFSTIWRFREELIKGNIIDLIWDELHRQLEAHGVAIKKGMIQDASFIQADPGKKHSGMNGRGREAKTSRSKDGSWTKKGSKSIFGFKAHHKVDSATKIITKVAVTTAKTFDGNIDLANDDEIVYRDRGYSGSGTKAKGNASMKKGKLTPHQQLRNKRITKTRCRGEHPYGTMHRSFKAGRTKLTTIARVFIQHVFVCFAYNVHRMKFLLTKRSASSP
jgi:IS5 family transposase